MKLKICKFARIALLLIMIFGVARLEDMDTDDYQHDDDYVKEKDPLEFGDSHFMNLSLHEKDTILMFVDHDKMDSPYMKVFREAAEKHGEDSVQFGYTTMERNAEERKMTETMGDRMAYSLDMEISEQPCLVAVNGGDYRPLYLKPDMDALTLDDFDSFVNDLKMNTTKQYLKSQTPFNNTGKSMA